MFLVHFIFILCFCLNLVTGQVCVTSSDTPQCSTGEICLENKCGPALYCGKDPDCAGSSGRSCKSDYCQLSICSSTGECVHGQVCSQYTYGSACVYLVLLEAKEGSNVPLTLAESSTPGTYEEIRWHRDGIYSFDDLVAWYRQNTLSHYMDKVKLNTTTGALTLVNVTVEDEGFYYYYFRTNSEGISNTGLKYEYRLKLDVTPEATIQGVSDKPVEVGTQVTLTCTAVKVKANTQFSNMYWMVGGRNESGRNTIEEGVLVNKLVHEVTKEDEGNPITCVVVPSFTDPVTVEKYINPGYAPTGKPVVQVSTMSQYNDGKVTLTCEDPEAAGNPPCNAYDWIKHGENINNLPNTKIHTFIIDQFHAGNYSCQCSNVFGESDVSDVVEILHLRERPKDNEGEMNKVTNINGGLIAGCVIGVLVLVALVVVGVIVCKRYNIKLNIQTKTRDQDRKEEGGNDNQAYEIPVSNLKPTDTDNNNMYEEPLSEMSKYEDINENEIKIGGEVGYINTVFPTYEEIHVGNPESEYTDTSII